MFSMLDYSRVVETSSLFILLYEIYEILMYFTYMEVHKPYKHLMSTEQHAELNELINACIHLVNRETPKMKFNQILAFLYNLFTFKYRVTVLSCLNIA